MSQKLAKTEESLHDPLVDRNCCLLDGACDCDFTLHDGHFILHCEKYDSELKRKENASV